MEAPIAARRPHSLTAHGHNRSDDWHWMRQADDPEVVAHLEAENRYTDSVLAPTANLQEQLFQEIRTRIVETDAGPPARDGRYWYFTRTEEGRQYPIHCRLPDPGRTMSAAEVVRLVRPGPVETEEVILDENTLAGEGGYLSVGVLDLAPDHSTLAYAVDLDGSEEHTLRFRDLRTGRDLPDVIERVHYASAWSAEGRFFFYTRPDDAMRPWQVWCHRLGTAQSQDRLVFEENDERFFLEVSLSRSKERVVITSASKTTSEVCWLDARDPAGTPTVLLRRRPGVEYDADHAGGSQWYVRSNHPAADGSPSTDFAVWEVEEGSEQLTEVVAHRPGVKIEMIEVFRDWVVVAERSAEDGLERLTMLDRSSGGRHTVDQPEPVYALLAGHNPEWDPPAIRFGYTSLVTPRTSVDYDPVSRRREEVWAQAIGGGYDREAFKTERLWAVAPDGARIPISVLARSDHRSDGSAPCLLYGYGAYESTIDPTFSAARLNLVERGAIFAMAHVRGGGELGRAWYEAGRMENKVNTFTDFIAAAEQLVRTGWVAADRIVARGGSAGGLLMGAVANLRPDLWRAIVAEVPFVDVVTTMSDTSLPLTITEWEEWGNPLHDADAYWRMLAYSPYDNVTPKGTWPAFYVTGGLNDTRVGFWEPAKWVAKLRTAGAGSQPERPLLLRTEMGAGHSGPSGRYDAWRDEARVQAFILWQMGLVPVETP